jgi:ELWxxDGT repeat protein
MNQSLRRLTIALTCALAFATAPASAAPTPPKPTLVKVVDPQIEAGGGPKHLVAGKDYLFFSTYVGGINALWRSDGTSAGTKQVEPLPFAIDSMMAAEDRAYFATAGAIQRSDGVSTSSFATVPYGPAFLGTSGTTLFFSAYTPGASSYRTIWATDGTTTGTMPLFDHENFPSLVYAGGGNAFFVTEEGVWTSNGTAAGTTLVAWPAMYTRAGTAFGSRFLFTKKHVSEGAVELWLTDGTAQGTQNITGTNVFTKIDLQHSAVLKNVLYFWAATAANGAELWRTDGTIAGTKMVIDSNPGTADGAIPVLGSHVTVLASRDAIFFTAANGSGTGTKVFRTDGTSSGTSLVIDADPKIAGEGAVRGMTIVNDWLFFIGRDTNGYERFAMSDGTPAGTVLLDGLFVHYYDTTFTEPRDLTAWNGSLYFVGDEGTNGYELWRIQAPPSYLPPDPKPAADAGADGGAGSGGGESGTASDGDGHPASTGDDASPPTSSTESGCSVEPIKAPDAGWIAVTLAAFAVAAVRARRASVRRRGLQ